MASLGGKMTHGARRAGRAPLSYSADANKTLTQTEAENEVLDVGSGTSLGATRNLVVPAPQDGDLWCLRNNATGAQSLQLIGPTGTGITVATTKAAYIQFDGTNMIRLTPDA